MTIALAAVGAALATLRRHAARPLARAAGARIREERADGGCPRARGADGRDGPRADRHDRADAASRASARACSGSSPGRSTWTRCLTRVLEAAGAVEGVDAALMTVAAPPGGEPIVLSLGLSEDGGRTPGGARAAGRTRGARDLDVLRVRQRRGGPRGEAIRSGVAVPLPGETAPARPARPSSRARLDHDVRRGSKSPELEELALRAGPAIENARRFREARQLADLDALTGLHNRRLLPRDAGPRGLPRAPLRPQSRADHLRPRRLQGDQRPHRAPLGRRRARRGGGADPGRRPLGRHRVQRRRRRVRGHPPRVAARRRGPALRTAADGAVVEAGRAGGPADDVRRHGRAAAGRRRDRVLPAGRPCAVRREGSRQGPGRRREPGQPQPPANMPPGPDPGPAARRADRTRRRASPDNERQATRGSPPSIAYVSRSLLLAVERGVDLGDFLGLDRVARRAVAGVAAVRLRLAAEVDPELLQRQAFAVAGADLLERAQ